MSIVLDYTSRIAPADLRAADVSGVCRYLSWLYRWGGQTHTSINPKIIQKPEYDELRAAGIDVTLNWEYDARDWLGGAMAGADHAREAAKQARALGYPTGSTIIGSADFDMTHAEWLGLGKPYAVAFATGLEIAGYRPGVYGPWDVLTWVRDAGIMDAFWQAGMSTSWSGGRNKAAWPGAHLRQRGHKTVGGQDTDWNEILIPNWGEDDMATVDTLRLKLIYENWAPSKDEWVKAGGDPAVYDTLDSNGSGLNGLALKLDDIATDAKTAATKAGGAPTQEQVNAAVAGLVDQIAVAVADKLAARLAS